MEKIFHFLSKIELAQGKSSDVEVLRTGIIQDRGFKITRKMLADYITNFKNNVYGTELQVNLEHNRGSEAAGWIKDLYIIDHQDTGVASLMAKVEWTELGQEKISKNLFKFVSAELATDFPHHETGKPVKNVFIGLALTNTPALKGQQPVTLNEAEEKLFINNRMIKTILEDLKKREFVSKADKALVKTLLEEMAEGEEKTEAAAAAAEVEAKPEEAKAAEEKPAEEAKPAEQSNEQLSEKLVTQDKEIKTLREKVERTELGEVVNTLLLDEKKGKEGMVTGLAGADIKEKAVSFMLGLTQEQRETFKTLINAVQTVDLATKGKGATDGGDGQDDGDEDDLDENVTKYAAELMEKDSKLSIEDAQKKAMKKFAKK